MKIRLFDLETNNLLDKVTTIHCCVTCDVDTGEVRRFNSQPDGVRMPGVGTIAEGIAYLQEADVLVAHNGVNYDRPVLRKLFPKIVIAAKSIDTIVLAKLLWPDMASTDFNNFRALIARGFPKNLSGSHSLKAWGYRLGERKGEMKPEAEGADKWAVWTQDMEDYCVQDVKVMLKLYQTCMAKSPSPIAIEIEHEFAEIMQLQEAHGFAFDKGKAVALYEQLCKRRLEIEAQMKTVFPSKWKETKTPEYYEAQHQMLGTTERADTKGELTAKIKLLGWKAKEVLITPGPMGKKEIEFNPSSRLMIATRFMERGWKPMKFTPEGQPQIDEEVLTAMVYPEAKVLLEYLLVVKRIGQVAEGPKAWLKLASDDADGVCRMHGRVNPNGAATGRVTHANPNMGQTPSVDSAYGNECRELFGVASTRHRLVGCDASGIQLRMLAHYMARYDAGAYVKVVTEGDPHECNRVAAGLAKRSEAKTFIYAWLFGAGDELIGAIVGGGAKEGRLLKNRFLRNMPALRLLKEAVETAVKTKGYLVGLDGRHISTRSAHSALNFLLQGGEAVIMKKANTILFKDIAAAGLVWGKDWAQTLFCHDEFQHEVLEQHAQLVGEISKASIKKAGEFFKLRCPLDGEFKIGNNWKETH